MSRTAGGSVEALAERASALAIIARARRVAECERQVLEAVGPILAAHRCRLGTIQEVVDGRGGAVRVVVMALE